MHFFEIEIKNDASPPCFVLQRWRMPPNRTWMRAPAPDPSRLTRPTPSMSIRRFVGRGGQTNLIGRHDHANAAVRRLLPQQDLPQIVVVAVVAVRCPKTRSFTFFFRLRAELILS